MNDFEVIQASIETAKLRKQIDKLCDDLRYVHITEIASWQLRELYKSLGDVLRRRNHLDELYTNQKPNS